MNTYKTISMSREQWKKWDAALRSGKYEQGQGLLKTSDGRYCCLGVLQQELDGEVEQQALVAGGFATNSLPTDKWLISHNIAFSDGCGYGDPCNNPYLPSLGRSASGANDTGSSFVKIADAIKLAVEFTD